MNVKDKIAAAIAAGEQVVEAKRVAEEAKKREFERQAVEYETQLREEAETWVENELPWLIQDRTARGSRSIVVNRYQADVCDKLGMTVTEVWVEGWNDEGARFGDYWRYELTW